MGHDEFSDFFVASAGVAGALIGLLFVAVSVSRDRLAAGDGAPVHAVRAAAALTAFSNALVVSLFALVPGANIRGVAVAVSSAGLLSMIACIASLIRTRSVHLRRVRDVLFVAGLTGVFVVQLVVGLHDDEAAIAPSDLRTLATLIVVCFIVGVARSWELIGGPSIKFRGEMIRLGETSRVVDREDTST